MPIVKDFPTENFLQVHNDVVRDQRLSFETRGVLMYLLSRSAEWEPCISDISDHGNMGFSKTKRILAELEAAGYIKKFQARGVGNRFGSVSRTVYARPCLGPTGVVQPDGVSIHSRSDGSRSTETGATEAVRRERETLKKEELKKEKQKTDNEIRSSDNDQHFDDFWSAWPKKVGKEAARKAWRKVKDKQSTLELINENLRLRQAAGQWTVAKYVPNPASYINGRQWEDVVYEERASSASRSVEDICSTDF